MALPLEGLKVADFTWIIAGTQFTRFLADYGATVVKVESTTYPDLLRTAPPYLEGQPGWNRSGYFATFSANKLSLTLNLNHTHSREVLQRLISWSDVVTESFTPGTMERWGLDYHSLTKIKPDIVMVSVSNQGQTGPASRHPGIGPNAESLTGYYHLTGWADRLPSHFYGVPMDVMAPRFALCALMAALEHRERTGEGSHLDISQMETAAYSIGPVLMDFFANGRETVRDGNRSPYACPHGVFPCQGDDCWCAIAVETEAQWQALCRAMGKPELATDTRFATLSYRKEHEAELEQLICTWTATLGAEEVMERLQKAGVPAGVVASGEEVYNDPGLVHREHLWHMEHPEMGRHGYQTFSFALSRTPALPRHPAPCIGEHSEVVLTQLLGYSEEEFISLLETGVLE